MKRSLAALGVLLVFACVGIAWLLSHPTEHVVIERVPAPTTTVAATARLPADTTYAEFQRNLMTSLKQQGDLGKAPSAVGPITMDCALPKQWTAGAVFDCNVFEFGGISEMGTATITVESTNPGQQFTYEFTWQANS